MITIRTRFDDGTEPVYTVDRATRYITGDPGDQVPLLVEEALESDEPIGPQVDEFSGAWGNWGQELNVVAAFMDATRRLGGRVVSWDSTDPPDPVTD